MERGSSSLMHQSGVILDLELKEIAYEEVYDSVERPATTATGLDAEQDKGIISKTQFTTTLNEPSSIMTSSGNKPRRQETMRDVAAQTKSERVSKLSNDPPLSRVNILRSGEDRLQLTKLMELCVLDDEEVVADNEVSTTDPVTTTDEVVTTAGVEDNAATTTSTISMNDITLAKALASLKSEKPMLKNKSFKEVQKAFDNTMSWIKLFVPMEKDKAEGSETRVEGSSKRAGEELKSNKSKKQKLDEHVEVKEDNDQEEAEMKICIKIISDDEIEIDAIPLATKHPIIVDWKIIKEGKISSYHIIRHDGSSKRPEDACERVLWGDLKVMFEPDIEKKRYPFTPATITEMLNMKLQADHWNEICYQLLKLVLNKKRRNEVFGYILLVKIKLLIKKLKDSEGEHQV
nr:hypothetical protein [Tanacetum cinerariifolium]